MTLVERNGKWGVKQWDSGKARYIWLGTRDTREEAEALAADNQIKSGSDSPTIEQWGRIWLSDYARPAPATQRTYRYAVERITADVGARRLTDLGRREARKIAGTWPKSVSRVARTMWADAVRDELCEINPWTNLRLETPRGRKDLTALTEPEIGRLADMACSYHGEYGVEVRAIILTLAYTGVRPGELCTLRRSDLDGSDLVVRFNLDGTGVEKPPKNGKARIVYVPPQALSAIGEVPKHLNDDHIFHTVRGKRLNKSSLSYMWRPVVAAWKQAGGKDLDLYELRHACATLLLERGLSPQAVANQLGHQDHGRLVQLVYGHPDERRMREQAALAFSEIPAGVRRAEQAHG